jgi:hypothetical protein
MRVAKAFPRLSLDSAVEGEEMELPGVSSDSHDSGRKACYNLLHRYGLRLRAPFSYNPKVFVTDEHTD